jgi:hypothetical protein
MGEFACNRGGLAALLSLAMIPDSSVLGQESAGNSGGAINLGGLGWLAPEGRPERAENQLEYEIRGGFVTDYSTDRLQCPLMTQSGHWLDCWSGCRVGLAPLENAPITGAPRLLLL